MVLLSSGRPDSLPPISQNFLAYPKFPHFSKISSLFRRQIDKKKNYKPATGESITFFSFPGRLWRLSFPRRAPAAPLRCLVGRLRRPKISSPRTLPNPRFFLRSGGFPRFFLRIYRTTVGKKKLYPPPSKSRRTPAPKCFFCRIASSVSRSRCENMFLTKMLTSKHT